MLSRTQIAIIGLLNYSYLAKVDYKRGDYVSLTLHGWTDNIDKITRVIPEEIVYKYRKENKRKSLLLRLGKIGSFPADISRKVYEPGDAELD